MGEVKSGQAIDIAGKLRSDADLLWFYNEPYSGCGRPRVYDGKMKPEKELDH